MSSIKSKEDATYVVDGTELIASVNSAGTLGKSFSINRVIAFVLSFFNIYNVKYYGAVGDGVTDDTAAITACKVAAGSNSTVSFPMPSVSYLITSQITMTGAANNACYFKGEGGSPRGVPIQFEPTAHDKSCFYWDLTQNPGGISGFWFKSADKTYRKTAITFDDGSDFHISDIHIGLDTGAADTWGDTSQSSVGIQGYGREVISICRTRIFADNPIKFGVNPNHSTIDMDQFHLYDNYLIVTDLAPNASVFIADECSVFNLTIDGYNAWALGKYGLYWNTTTNARVSHGIKISGIRFEQGNNIGGDGYCIYINNSGANTIREFSIDHCYGDLLRNRGFYLKGFQDLRMTNCRLLGPADGSGTCLEIADNSTSGLRHVQWDNCIFGIYGAASIIPDELILLPGAIEYPQEDPLLVGTASIKLPISAKYRRKKTTSSSEQGQLISEGVRHVYLKADLISPQTGAADLSFAADGVITSAGAVDFTGITVGQLIFVDGSSGGTNDGWVTVTVDGTATTVGTNETFTVEATSSATIIHGLALPHRGQITTMQKTEISVYAENEADADMAQYLLDNSGLTGQGSAITNPAASTIIARNFDGGTTLPDEDTFCYKSVTQPAQFWNVRGYAPVGGGPGAKSIAHVFVEQTNW